MASLSHQPWKNSSFRGSLPHLSSPTTQPPLCLVALASWAEPLTETAPSHWAASPQASKLPSACLTRRKKLPASTAHWSIHLKTMTSALIFFAAGSINRTTMPQPSPASSMAGFPTRPAMTSRALATNDSTGYSAALTTVHQQAQHVHHLQPEHLAT